jgi:hypothetical protein
MEDPELAFDRAMETYLKKGYTKEWVNQRFKSIEVRKELTYVPIVIGRLQRSEKGNGICCTYGGNNEGLEWFFGEKLQTIQRSEEGKLA